MLRVKFWRIENVVLMKVLEQGDEIVRGGGVFFEADTPFILSSRETPKIFQENKEGKLLINYILVRGNYKGFDNRVVAYELSSEIEAINFYNGAVNTVKEYNNRIKKSKLVEIESVIAE